MSWSRATSLSALLVLGWLAAPRVLATAQDQQQPSSDTAQPHSVERFSARAYVPGTRQRLYSEQHRLETRHGRPVREEVIYRDPGGKLFARKTLLYGADAAAPSFHFEDYRSGRIEAARRKGKYWLLSHRNSRDQELEQELVETDGVTLVDEGYRALLRTHFPRLLRGASVVADAIVPARLTSYDMRFSGRGVTDSGGRELLVVHLDMDDFLLRLIGPSADLYFDLRTRSLVRFEGLANIRDASGDPQQASILYRYHR